MQTKLVRVDDLHRFFSSFFKKNRFFFSVAPFLAIASPSSTFFYRFSLPGNPRIVKTQQVWIVN